jgi:hypothetical protein
MPIVQTIARICREHFIKGKTIKEIAGTMGKRAPVDARSKEFAKSFVRSL